MEWKEQLLKEIDENIEFAKGCGMPQFTMGLLQARKTIEGFVPVSTPMILNLQDGDMLDNG